jgi:hypothetical protein
MRRDDGVVPAVRLPENIEDVAGERDRAEASVDQDVERHAGELAFRHPELRRLPQEPERDQRRRAVADPGEQPEKPVGADADPGARDADRAVEKIRDPAETGEAPFDLRGREGGVQRTMRQLPSGWRQAVP